MTAADDIADLFIHEVTIETLTGAGDWGATTFAPLAGPVPCLIVDKVQTVRDPTGAETVSTAQVYAGLDAGPLLAPGSRVHLPGRVATVIALAVNDGTALDLPSSVNAALT